MKKRKKTKQTLIYGCLLQNASLYGWFLSLWNLSCYRTGPNGSKLSSCLSVGRRAVFPSAR